MKRFKTILLALLTAAASQAQPFAITWLSHPAATASQHVWFRNTIDLNASPAEAVLSVSTTGLVDIYINERNITTDVLVPHRENPDETAVTIDFDVRRFLRKGENIVAIWYAPSDVSMPRMQVAATLSGKYDNGEYFAVTSPDGWICRIANRWTTQEGEAIDASEYEAKWNSDDYDIATWIPAETLSSYDATTYHSLYDRYIVEKVNRIRTQDYIDIENNTFYYEFKTGFRGWIRLTFRGRKSGEKIVADNLEYVCKGQTDEQAFHKFTIGNHRRVTVTSSQTLSPDNPPSIEAIEIIPEYRSFCFY